MFNYSDINSRGVSSETLKQTTMFELVSKFKDKIKSIEFENVFPFEYLWRTKKAAGQGRRQQEITTSVRTCRAFERQDSQSPESSKRGGSINDTGNGYTLDVR